MEIDGKKDLLAAWQAFGQASLRHAHARKVGKRLSRGWRVQAEFAKPPQDTARKRQNVRPGAD